MKKRKNIRAIVFTVLFLILLAGSLGTIWIFRQWLFVDPREAFPVDNVVYAAQDSDGNILALDNAGSRLVKIRDGYILWKADGSKSTFSGAKRLTTDSAGNIYVQNVAVKSGTRLDRESIVKYSPDGKYLGDVVTLDSSDLLRTQIASLIPAADGVLWVWRLTDEVRLMDAQSEVVAVLSLPDADRMVLSFAYDPATETLWYSTYDGRILRYSREDRDAVLYDSAAVLNGKRSVPRTISYSDGVLYAVDYGMRDIIAIRTDTGEVSRLAPDIPRDKREIAYELNADHGLMAATAYSVMAWNGENFDFYYEAQLNELTQRKCIALWAALLVLALIAAAGVLVLFVRFIQKSNRFTKIGFLIVAGVAALGLFILGTLMPQVDEQYADAIYSRERLAATVTAEHIPIESFLELDSASDFYGEDYIAVKEAVDAVFFADTEDAENLYCALYRVIDRTVTQVYALDDTCIIYPFDTDYDLTAEKEILTSGEGQTLISDTSEGRFIFVLLPIKDSDGVPVGLIEVGTDLNSYEAENRKMFVSMLINVLAITVVIVLIAVEALHFAQGRDEVRRAQDAGIVLPVLPSRILRFIVFLVFFFTNLTTAIFPLYAMGISQNSRTFGLQPELLTAIPISAEVVAGAIFSIFGNAVIQALGPKRSVRICAALFTIGLALRAAPDIWLVTAGSAVVGVGWGVILLLVNIQISSMPEEEKDAGFAHYSAAVFSGVNSGVALGGFLLQWLTYSLLFILTAVVSVAFYFVVSRYLTQAPENQDEQESAGGPFAAFRFLFAPRVFLFFLMIVVPVLICGYFLNYLFPIIGADWGLSETYIGYAYLLNGLCVMAFGSALTNLFTRFRKKKLALAVASLLYAAAFTLVARLQSVPALLAAVALLGLSDSFGQPLQTGYFTDLEEVQRYGYDRALGVFNLVSNAAQSLGSFVFSYALLIGVGKGLIVASAVLAGLGFLFLLFGGRTRTAKAYQEQT